MASIPVERGRRLVGTPHAALRGVKATLNIVWALRSQCPMLGSPEAGTSILACRLTTVLPAITVAEAIETTHIHSVAGLTGARR